MKLFYCFLFTFIPILSTAQTPDNVQWCPPGATWVYSEFSATTNRNLQLTYLKDTIIAGKTVKQLEAKKIELSGPNLVIRTTQILGYEYYYNSNDSVFFLDNNEFRFAFDFTPQVNDKWVVGSTKVTCPTSGFPAQDTVTVDSIMSYALGNKSYSFILNNSFTRNYVLGSIIKNIGSQNGPYPYVNRNKCPFSDGFFQGLICYKDNIRGEVPMPGSSISWCNSIITPIKEPPAQTHNSLLIAYPNPVINIIRFKQKINPNSNFLIYNYSGQIVLDGKYDPNGIIVKQLTKGIYFIKVFHKNTEASLLKFLKL